MDRGCNDITTLFLFFICESDSTFTNVCPFVCPLVIHPSSIIIFHSPFIILHSFFILLHSSFLHFPTFKLFSLFFLPRPLLYFSKGRGKIWQGHHGLGHACNLDHRFGHFWPQFGQIFNFDF